MMSPPLPVRVSTPSTTVHPSGMVFCRYPRQPAVVLPSSSDCHPPCCAAASAAITIMAAVIRTISKPSASSAASADLHRAALHPIGIPADWFAVEVAFVGQERRRRRSKTERGVFDDRATRAHGVEEVTEVLEAVAVSRGRGVDLFAGRTQRRLLGILRPVLLHEGLLRRLGESVAGVAG